VIIYLQYFLLNLYRWLVHLCGKIKLGMSLFKFLLLALTIILKSFNTMCSNLLLLK